MCVIFSIRKEIDVRHRLITLSLVHNYDKAGIKCYTQDNTNTLETQVCEKVPGNSKLHVL